MRHPLRKLLRRCQGQQGVGLHLDRRCLAAAAMQEDRIELSGRQTIGMGQCLGQRQRLLHSMSCTVIVSRGAWRNCGFCLDPHPDWITRKVIVRDHVP